MEIWDRQNCLNGEFKEAPICSLGCGVKGLVRLTIITTQQVWDVTVWPANAII